MSEDGNIIGFGMEAHLHNNIHYHHFNKTTIGDTIDAAIDHYKNWGSGKIEIIILTPKYD